MDKQKQINILREVILSNKEGFSCNLNGKPINKKEGYFISITNIKGKSLNHLIKKVLYIKQFGFKGNNNLFIDGWTDRENNFYLDLSLYLEDLNLSKQLGLIFKQKAIFNISKFESIYLK